MIQAIHRQFLLTFAAMGAVLAYLPVLLEQRLGSATQVGLVMSTTGLAIILTPVIMTALADTRLQSRSIIATLFAVSAGACVWQALSHSFAALFVSHTVFAFAFWPLAALQDGLVFASNQQAELDGRPITPYHRVRVFGTIGFALPLAGLYFLLRSGLDVGVALHLGGALCILGTLNALTLPRTQLAQARKAQGGRPQVGRASRRSSDTTHGRDARATSTAHPAHEDSNPTPDHPTAAAARVLFRGPALVFCAFLFIAHLGNSAYYAFYPIYLTNTVHFDDAWVGPVTMLGVVLELGVMTSVGLLLTQLGLKRLLVLGLVVMALRFALLGLWPAQHVAVWTQVFHGVTVIAVYVIPPIYLNHLAGDHFRSSIQGLYAMVVFGPARIAGNVLAGWLADASMTMVFNLSAATTLLAALGIALFMRLPRVAIEQAEDVPVMVEGD